MSTTSSGPILPVRHGVLLPALRRDLTDLNDQYLDLGTAPGAEGDPRCAWSDEVRQCLREAGPATRAVMAAAPFALFELVIAARPGPPVAGRVADERSAGGSPLMHGRWISFAHQAAFLAWRLVDTAPLAARLTLGLAPPAQVQLSTLRPSQVAEAAAWPGLIRARWPGHLRYWRMLAGAARRDSATGLQWAHCVGLCLLGADGAELSPPGAGTRRRPRR